MRSTYIFFIVLLSACIENTQAQINASWKLTGPAKFPTNSGGQINGIGHTTQISFHPTNPNKLYAVTASGGLFISTDLGVNWNSTGTDQLPDMYCSSVVVDPVNSNTLYIGSNLGVWKSTNDGVTFNQSTNGMGNRQPNDMIIDPANNQVIVAATNDGIWKTTNAGGTWTIKKSGGGFDMMKVKPNDPQTLYAVTTSAFFRSTNMGETWTQITVPGGNSGGGRIGVSKANPNIVYLTFVKGAGGKAPVYKSTDAGLTFTTVKPANTYDLNGYTESQSGQGNYNYGMTVDPLNANNVWVCGHCVFKSTDGGVNWSRKTSWSSIVHTDMHQLIYSPHDGTKLFDANDGGVWINSDGGTGSGWLVRSDGLSCTENYHGAQSPIKKDRVSCGTQDNGEIYYDAGKWYTNRGGDWGEHVLYDYQNSNWIYYYGTSPTTGSRRTSLTGGEQGLSFPFVVNNSTPAILEFTPLAKNKAFLTNDNVWRTDNLTSNPPSWNKISTFNETVKAICISPVDVNVVYIVTSSGKVFRSDNATNANASFTNISAAPSSVSSKASIAVIKSTPDVVYMSCNSKVYRSANKGVTWTDVSTGLPGTNFIKMYHDIYSMNEGLYIANGAGAVYYKNKNLTSWVNYSKGLPTICNVTDFMIFNDGNYSNSVLRIAYYGRGVWETPLYNPINGLEEIANDDTYLLNVFPNPGEKLVNVSFTLAQTSNVGLEVYDMLGKVVNADFKIQQLNPGEYTFPIDISSLVKGTYLCKLTVDGVVKSKLLVKE